VNGDKMMLTSNFVEIIQVVITKVHSQTLETIPADDIRNISLMLWGYLRLIKSGFKTQADSHESSEEHYASLKNVLNVLTYTQSQHISQAKRNFLEQCTQELNTMNEKIEALPSLIVQTSTKNRKIITRYVSDIKNCNQKLKDKLNTELNGFQGFKLLTKSHFDCSTEITELMSSLFSLYPNDQITEYLKLFQNSLTFYAKKLLWWHEIESTNEQCRVYALNGELIDMLTDS
jgi:hypothetical protein